MLSGRTESRATAAPHDEPARHMDPCRPPPGSTPPGGRVLVDVPSTTHEGFVREGFVREGFVREGFVREGARAWRGRRWRRPWRRWRCWRAPWGRWRAGTDRQRGLVPARRACARPSSSRSVAHDDSVRPGRGRQDDAGEATPFPPPTMGSGGWGVGGRRIQSRQPRSLGSLAGEAACIQRHADDGPCRQRHADDWRDGSPDAQKGGGKAGGKASPDAQKGGGKAGGKASGVGSGGGEARGKAGGVDSGGALVDCR